MVGDSNRICIGGDEMKRLELNITDCFKCPYLHDGVARCCSRDEEMREPPIIDEDENSIFPDWCPLGEPEEPGQIVMSRPYKLAEDHWEWLEEMLHKVYVDAMVHGYKHGFDEGYECRENE
jgi:hypothetical protein